MDIDLKQDGCNLHIKKEGQGPALLLIHGAGADFSTFAEAAGYLKTDYTVVIYNRCGYSDSMFYDKERENDPSRYLVSQQALDAKAVLDRCGIQKAIIAAHSAGCMVALELARLYPDSVAGLVLYEPAIAFGENAGASLMEWKDQLQRAADKNRIVNALLIFMNALGGIDERAPKKDLQQQAQSLENLQVFLHYEIQDFLTYADRIEGALHLKMPCVLGNGTLHGESMLSRLAPENAKWMGARLDQVEGYHNFPEERPKEFSMWVRDCISGMIAI